MARTVTPTLRVSATVARRVRLLVLDVDGVLTDGRLYFGAGGEQLKVFHVRDGHGIKQVQAAGITVAVISGRKSAAVARRCRELGIRHVTQGAGDKSVALATLLGKLGITGAEAACVGDDTPDLAVFAGTALAFAVADAHPEVLAAADRVTGLPGGRGAVREVCDALLRARGAT
ncbi:MAG: hypothetical protein RL026_479 [Pseudomonadota bacterium]